MASGEDIDSGMDSPVPDETPVKKRQIEDEEEEVGSKADGGEFDFHADWRMLSIF